MKPSPGPWRWKNHRLWDADGWAVIDDRKPKGAGVRTDVIDDRTLISLAPEMREMLLRLEWVDVDRAVPHCPVCFEGKGGYICSLGALLERIR